MAKDKADGKTVDFVSGKAGQTKTAAERREYLRIKKRESRNRQRQHAHKKGTWSSGERAEMTDQVTLTLSYGAKAILEKWAEEENSSMTLVVESLIMNHRKAAALRAKLPGLFVKG